MRDIYRTTNLGGLDPDKGSSRVCQYAEKHKRPLWLTLRANVGGAGTTYTLMGAVIEPDSAKAKGS